MSAELETLDQLLGGDLPLQIIRDLYPDDETFAKSLQALLRNGDVRLLMDGVEVPQWRWRELNDRSQLMLELPRFRLAATDQGARRVT